MLKKVIIALAVLAALAILLPLYGSRVGQDVVSCLRDCADPDPRRSGPLRVMTLNVYHGYLDRAQLRKRLRLIAGEIRRRDIDIALLQEVSWTGTTGSAAAFLAERAGRNHVYVRANGNYAMHRFEEGLAILSRWPLRGPRFTELEPQSGIFVHRAALAAAAETPWGTVRLATTHLARRRRPEINAAQLASFRTFLDSLGDGPVIVGGDFNARENAPHMRAFSAGWIDAFRSLRRDPGLTCCLDRRRLEHADAGRLFARVDYIFLRPETWQVLRAESIFDRPLPHADGVLWASNHIGVYAEVVPPD